VKEHYFFNIQGVSGGNVNILRDHSIDHSKKKSLYDHVSLFGTQYFPSFTPCARLKHVNWREALVAGGMKTESGNLSAE
jgi:hypothetical protein